MEIKKDNFLYILMILFACLLYMIWIDVKFFYNFILVFMIFVLLVLLYPKTNRCKNDSII